MNRSLRASAALAIALTTALVFAACTASSTSSGSSSSTLTVGSTSAVKSWDPAYVGDANDVPYAQATYDSLIRRTVDNTYVPMLATKWTISDDKKSITLELRKDVTFSDGAKFDADAVKANIEHFAKAAGPLGNEVTGYQSADIANDYEITLNFAAPLPDIVYNLSDAAGRMASPKALDSSGLKTVPVGTGPYVMDTSKTVQGSTYTLTARKGYWDKSLQKFGAVVFKIFPTETGLLNALKSGQVDAGNLSVQDNVASAKASGISVLNPKYHISWAGLIFLDRSGKMEGPLANKDVRLAIAHAIDAKGINQVAFNGGGVLTNQIFNESSAAYDTSLNSAYAYDPAESKKLLAQAGYPNGFKLTMPGGGLMTPAIQTALQKELGEVGITLDYTNVPGANLYGDMASGKLAIAYVFFGSVPTDWSVVQNFLTTTSTWNPSKTEDPDLTALINKIPNGSDDERIQDFKDINKFVVDNAWFDPWFWVPENFAVNKTVKVELQPLNNVPFIYNYSSAK